jgi:hypothetical protein
MLRKIKKFLLRNHLLIAILVLASFLRLFRINELLGFWYDQGRDALVIWDFLHKGKFFLIGPMMGFTGMFRGPWYYWLITPFYFLGRGNPLYPSVFLILTSVVAIWVLYKVGEGWGGAKTGLLSATIASVSLVGASRWLSDPTPTFLVSILFVWSLFNFLKKKSWALPLAGLLVGLSLQFSAATEIFYIPALLLIFWINRKILPSFKIIFLSIASFLVVFIPQGMFEFRHPGVLSGALYQFIFHEKTFTLSFWQTISSRLPFYYHLFYSRFWANGAYTFAPFFIIFLALMILGWKNFWKDDKFKIIFILSITPFVGTLFFIGNLGAIYDYYFTGYFLIWILLFSYIFIHFSRSFLIRLSILVFLILLFIQNFISFKQDYLTPPSDLKITAFSSQIEAIDWIYKDANGRDFNVDEYVPPVIPYAYQYLFEWLGTTKYHKLPNEESVPLLYTLEEADPDHPDRIQAWYDRQRGVATIQAKANFGIITVERRIRIGKK